MIDPLPKEEQMRAMLTGQSLRLIKECYSDANEVNFGKYLTVTKSELISFLKKEPLLTQDYANRNKFEAPRHDVYTILPAKKGYAVGWLDHGRLRDPIKFKTLEEAVAEHVFIQHGISG